MSIFRGVEIKAPPTIQRPYKGPRPWPIAQIFLQKPLEVWKLGAWNWWEPNPNEKGGRFSRCHDATFGWRYPPQGNVKKYPTWRKGTSSTQKCRLVGDMLVPRRVYLEKGRGCFFSPLWSFFFVEPMLNPKRFDVGESLYPISSRWDYHSEAYTE